LKAKDRQTQNDVDEDNKDSKTHLKHLIQIKIQMSEKRRDIKQGIGRQIRKHIQNY